MNTADTLTNWLAEILHGISVNRYEIMVHDRQGLEWRLVAVQPGEVVERGGGASFRASVRLIFENGNGVQAITRFTSSCSALQAESRDTFKAWVLSGEFLGLGTGEPT